MDPPLPPISPSPAKLAALSLTTPTKRRLELTPGATEDSIFGGLAPSIFGPSTPDATPSPSKRRSTANEQSTAVGFPITTRQDDNMSELPSFGPFSASEVMSLFDSDVAIGNEQSTAVGFPITTRQDDNMSELPSFGPFSASEVMSLFDSDVAIGVVPTRQESHATDSPTRRPALHHVHMPTEVLDMVFHNAVTTPWKEECHLAPPDPFECDWDKKLLATARLVCRAWNKCATPLLFSHVCAMMGRETRPYEPVFHISNSHLAKYVKQLRVGILGPWHENKFYHRYLIDTTSGALSVLLDRFPNIQAIRFISPTVIFPLMPEDEMTVDGLSYFTSSFVHALRYVPMPNLKIIYLSLPVTAEWARFFLTDHYTSEMTEVLARIQEAHLIVNDDTGRETYSTMTRPRSKVKALYPQQEFSGWLFNFIRALENVKTLDLQTYSPLDVSDLFPESFTNLTCLKLVNVSINWETLRDIFAASQKTLRRVELNSVRLMTGTWRDVFLLESTLLSDIEFFLSERNGYSMEGESAHFVGHERYWCSKSLLTTNIPDWEQWFKLKGRVNRNRLAKKLRIDLSNPW